MTRVSLQTRNDGTYVGFSCSGHTGYAKAGQDIVCAAVSFLSTTCANSLESVAGAKPNVDCSDGKLSISLTEPQLSHDTQVILKTFEQGMRDLQESYPDNVQFTVVNAQ